MDPRRWRCGDRCATGERLRRSVDRGRDTPWTARGLPTGCPHPCPPTASPSPHFHRWRPAAAIGATTLIFFQPLSGAFRPCALRLPTPFIAEQGQEGEPAKPGEPRRGAPGGSKGRPKGRTGGRHAPAPWGVRLPPSGGLLEGEGEPPGGRGNPAGVPRERSENSPKTDQKCCIEES